MSKKRCDNGSLGPLICQNHIRLQILGSTWVLSRSQIERGTKKTLRSARPVMQVWTGSASIWMQNSTKPQGAIEFDAKLARASTDTHNLHIPAPIWLILIQLDPIRLFYALGV